MAGRALIVDDHAGFRAAARRLLEAAGWDVVGEAGDGAGALAEAGRLDLELVLLDLNLPDASGLDVAERLTADPDHPAVLLISTHEDEELASLASARGACAFIPKHRLSVEALSAVVDPG